MPILKNLFPLLLILFSCVNSVLGQGSSTVYVHDFDAVLLSQLVKEKIDSVRMVHGLNPLTHDSILTQAALDQSKYLIANSNAKHSQQDKNKNTPAKRVQYYNGEFQLVGENILLTYIQEKLRASKLIEDIYYRNQTYEQAAQNIVAGWLGSRGHFANIIKSEYQYTGVSAALDSATNRVSITQVFGAKVYDKSSTKAVMPTGNKSTQSDELYTLPLKKNRNLKLAQQWSENLEQHIIGWFHCTPKSLKKAFRWYHFRSGLIVESEDVSLFTNESAYLNKPSRINQKSLKYGKQGALIKRNDLMKIARRNEILNGNGKRKSLKKKPKYLQIDRPTLGEDNGSERILVVRKGKICDIISITPHLAKEMNPAFPEFKYFSPFDQSISEYKKSTQVDSVSLKVYYERNQTTLDEDEIENINALIPLDAKVRKIKIEAFASIEGNAASNKELFKERARQFQRALKAEDLLTEDVTLELNTNENWDLMMQQIEEYPSFQSLQGNSKADIRAYFNNHSTDTAAVNALNNQRYAEITALLAYEKWTPLKPEDLLYKYDSLLSSKNKLSFSQLRQLGSYQEHYYETLISSKIENKNQLEVPQEARFSELLYKEALFKFLHEKSINETGFIKVIRQIGSTPKLSKALMTKLIQINLIAVTKQLFTFSDLSLDPADLNCKAERNNLLFIKPIKKHDHQTGTPDMIQLSLDVIPDLVRYQNDPDIKDLIHQAELYYWINKAQHVRKSGNIRQLSTINKLLNNIWNRHILKSELSVEERLDYAQFFNLFKKYDFSKDLIEPLVNTEKPNHLALMMWISLMTNENDEKEVEQEILKAKSILTKQEWATLVSSGIHLSNEFMERNEIRKTLQEL